MGSNFSLERPPEIREVMPGTWTTLLAGLLPYDSLFDQRLRKGCLLVESETRLGTSTGAEANADGVEMRCAMRVPSGRSTITAVYTTEPASKKS